MRGFFTKHGRSLAMIVAVFVGMMLVVSAIFLTGDYQNEVTKTASVAASLNTAKMQEQLKKGLYNYTTIAIAKAEVIHQSVTTEKDLKDYLQDLEIDHEGMEEIYSVKYARYLKDGILYDSTGEVYKTDGNVQDGKRENGNAVLNYIEKNGNTAGYAGLLVDLQDNMQLICFYSPVEKSEVADGIALYYTRQNLEKMYKESVATLEDESSFRLLCTRDGSIIGGDMNDESILKKDTIEIGNFITVMEGLLGSGDTMKQIKDSLLTEGDTFVSLYIGPNEYILSFASDEASMNDLVTVELFPVNTLSATGLEMIYAIVAIVVLFGLIAVGVIVYLIVHNVNIKKRLFDKEILDPVLNCLNRHGFEVETSKILDRNYTKYSAIVELHIGHFIHLQETYGKSETTVLLHYIRSILPRFLQREEAYGYTETGTFCMLMHAKDRSDLIRRVRLIAYAANKFRAAKTWNLNIKYGVFEIESNEGVSVPQMINYAGDANKTVAQVSEEGGGLPIHFYDNELRRIRQINETMELRMDYALQSGEFQVFYQPKFNLNTHNVDGAEALVRWYNVDTKEYQRPNLFMALFESNGFVIKLDKYVFSRVCEYISYSTSHNKPVYPISVNISRVTAMQPDFLEYYINEKRKYGIADGMIMIEFTESFAYDNYENLERVVNELHKGGFKCSVDDFGCGYSSYQILKSLPMDEIKLDRMFMSRGLSEERDNAIFDSIIRLAKKLNMKVTQEGVEENADVEKMYGLGCDVIQGYVYAKPMPLSDYMNFLVNAKSHELKY